MRCGSTKTLRSVAVSRPLRRRRRSRCSRPRRSAPVRPSLRATHRSAVPFPAVRRPRPGRLAPQGHQTPKAVRRPATGRLHAGPSPPVRHVAAPPVLGPVNKAPAHHPPNSPPFACHQERAAEPDKTSTATSPRAGGTPTAGRAGFLFNRLPSVGNAVDSFRLMGRGKPVSPLPSLPLRPPSSQTPLRCGVRQGERGQGGHRRAHSHRFTFRAITTPPSVESVGLMGGCCWPYRAPDPGPLAPQSRVSNGRHLPENVDGIGPSSLALLGPPLPSPPSSVAFAGPLSALRCAHRPPSGGLCGLCTHAPLLSAAPAGPSPVGGLRREPAEAKTNKSHAANGGDTPKFDTSRERA